VYLCVLLVSVVQNTRMKKLLITFLFSTIYISLVAQQNTVFLKGQLKNFSNQVEVEDLSDLQYLLPASPERIIIPDTAGKFSIRFKLESPNYFRIGRNILYLTPGDQMEVFIDKNSPSSGRFTGKGAAANLYLRGTPFPKAGSFVEAGRKLQKTAKATIDTILQMASVRGEELKKVTGTSKEFLRLETARVRADLINSLLAAQQSYKPRMSADSLAVYNNEYKELVMPLLDKYAAGFLDASYMKLVVYRDIAELVLKNGGNEKDAVQIREWMKSTALVNEMKKTSDKNQLSGYTSQINEIKTPSYKNAVKMSQGNLLKFGKGDKAIDFTAVDLSGKKVKLTSLKGKVIYVDLWATWCGPCLAEMPHYDELKNKYKANPDIAFVSLSIDDGVELWKKNVNARNADGLQWQINRNALTDYDIVTIPRSFLINKNFEVVDINAPVPSAKELPAMIDNLLKQ
jgi:thiol-disulfide isomerase/thioredoxin